MSIGWFKVLEFLFFPCIKILSQIMLDNVNQRQCFFVSPINSCTLTQVEVSSIQESFHVQGITPLGVPNFLFYSISYFPFTFIRSKEFWGRKIFLCCFRCHWSLDVLIQLRRSLASTCFTYREEVTVYN